MKIGVSACLLGDNTTYRGDSNSHEELIDLLKDYEVVKVCPEVLGGLSIPRNPAEIVREHPLTIKTQNDQDVTYEYITGAHISLDIFKQENIKVAILKARSPSCGVGEVYDGQFNHTIIKKDGVFARLLKENSIKLFHEDQIDQIKEYLKEIK